MSHSVIIAAYDRLVLEKEQYRTALEKIRWLEGVNPRAYQIALDALKVGDSERLTSA